MPWFKVDDAFHSHPKVMDLSLAAVGLWSRSGSYCAQHLTDGFVPSALVRLYGARAQARALVEARLWVEVAGGYQFHQWLERNPSREQIETEREAKRTAGRMGGKASGQSRANTKQKASSRFASDSEISNPHPDPSRPDPTSTTTTTKTMEAEMNCAPSSSEEAKDAREQDHEAHEQPLSLAARCCAARPAGKDVDYWTDKAVADAAHVASGFPAVAALGVEVVMLALAANAEVRSPKAIEDSRIREPLVAAIKQASKPARCEDCKAGLPEDLDRNTIPCPTCGRGGVRAA